MSQEVQAEIQSLKSQLDLANSRIQSAHQTLIEVMNERLELRAQVILVSNKSVEMQNQHSDKLQEAQREFNAQVTSLVDQVKQLTEENQRLSGTPIDCQESSAV